jgi:uncharacterized membrane protein
MSSPSPWALSLLYWLHMLATVIWVGGLASLSILILPAAGRTLEVSAYSRLLEAIQRRLDPLSWLCLAVLVGTGLFQMSANPNYQGFLVFNNRWAVAILIKHLVFGGMILTSAYLSWGLLPRLRRAALRRAAEEETTGLRVQEIRLLQINLVLSILILALTALARAS